MSMWSRARSAAFARLQSKSAAIALSSGAWSGTAAHIPSFLGPRTTRRSIASSAAASVERSRPVATIMPLIVERVTSSEMKQEAMNVRFRVFVDEQKFAAEIEIDEQDDLPTTVHFIGKDSETNEYVAVARCMVDKATRKGKIGRVAVLSKCRGKGFGFQIMQGIEAIMKGEVDSLSMHSQYDKKGFYEKCGYHCPTDEVFIEEGVEHCFMTKTIA